MLADERLQLGHRLGVAAERQVGLQPLLERDQAERLQAADLVAGERLVAKVGERRATPERERLPEQVARLLGGAVREQPPALGRAGARTAAESSAPSLDPDDISQRPRLEYALAERLAELRDVHLHAPSPPSRAAARPRARRRAASVAIVSPAWSSRTASSARCFAAPSVSSRPSSQTASGPRIPNSIERT